MSEREQIQERIVNWLEDHRDKFNAPYGVLPSLENVKNGKGKVRTVTFGQARWLDATVFIWTPRHLTVQAQGPAGNRLRDKFVSVEEFLENLEEL